MFSQILEYQFHVKNHMNHSRIDLRIIITLGLSKIGHDFRKKSVHQKHFFFKKCAPKLLFLIKRKFKKKSNDLKNSLWRFHFVTFFYTLSFLFSQNTMVFLDHVNFWPKIMLLGRTMYIVCTLKFQNDITYYYTPSFWIKGGVWHFSLPLHEIISCFWTHCCGRNSLAF